jgi:hypothetical protein
MSNNPYESPGLPADDVAAPPATVVSREKLRRVAQRQLRMIWATIGAIVIYVLGASVAGAPWGIAVTVVLAMAGISVLVFAMFVKLVHELYGWGLATLFGLAMLLPGAAVVLLLVVNYLATTYLRSRGVKAAFMGTDPATIA